MSRLVRVIVSWLTVRQAGTNLKLPIVTAAVPALGSDCDEPLDIGCGDALGFAAPCALRRTTNSLDRTGAGMPGQDGNAHRSSPDANTRRAPQTPIGDTDRLIAAGLLLRTRRRVS